MIAWIVVQVLENRLFSEGLHVLGRPPGEEAMGKYLDAFFDGKLSSESVQAVVHHHSDGLSAVRCALGSCQTVRRTHQIFSPANWGALNTGAACTASEL
jgi:cobalamin biosynthesis Mg chelatase CobN